MNENEMIEQGRKTAEAATETAREMTEKAQGAAREWAGRARDKARDVSVATDSYVRENAWASVGIVALVAAAIGYLIGRKVEG